MRNKFILGIIVWFFILCVIGFIPNSQAQGLFTKAKDIPIIGAAVGETVNSGVVIIEARDQAGNIGVSEEVEQSTAGAPSAPAFYVSPSGSGTLCTEASPCGTFTQVFSNFKADTTKKEIILKNGTYTKATTGLPNMDCSTGGNMRNGINDANRLTIKAENERQAHLDSDGTVPAFKIQDCSWWNIEGLQVSSEDKASGSGGTQAANPMTVGGSSQNINVRRILAHHTNRYFNQHCISVVGSAQDILVEESEAYYCHRHGITAGDNSQRVTLRRNYTHSREYSAMSNPGFFKAGSEGISLYDPDGSIIENSIAEKFQYGLEMLESCNNCKILGSISLNTMNYDGRPGGHKEALQAQSRNTTFELLDTGIFENVVDLNASGGGFRSTSVKNLSLRNISIINPGVLSGIRIQNGQGVATDTVVGTNILVYHGNSNGILIDHTVTSWFFDFIKSASNSDAFNPDDFTCPNCFGANRTTTNPTNFYNPSTGQGCIIYIPDTSNLKNAGDGGADIGANVINRYVNGSLTGTKLWNQSTGAFPCGATITGVNDDATFPTSACVNVHKRLNVGVNGCAIP